MLTVRSFTLTAASRPMLASITGSCAGSRLRESLHENALARATPITILERATSAERFPVTRAR
jgi:hypothetical protein